MKFDLHVHSRISACSRLSIEDILEHSRSIGLDGVCITDHDTARIRDHVREGRQSDGLYVIFGMEYTTLEGDFLVFGKTENLPLGMTFDQLSETIDKSGGIVIAAHPFRRFRSTRSGLLSSGRCRIIETINGRNTQMENAGADALAKANSLNRVGGSDAHSLKELGRVITRFDVPVRSRKDLIFAVKNGLCRPEWNPQHKLLKKETTATRRVLA